MAKKRFNKFLSLDEGEVVLEDVQEDEAFTEREQPTETEQESTNVVEATVSTCEPTQAEIKFAKQFTGTPTQVDYTSIELAKSCVSKKLLAEFGSDGYARGCRWHIYCK